MTSMVLIRHAAFVIDGGARCGQRRKRAVRMQLLRMWHVPFLIFFSPGSCNQMNVFLSFPLNYKYLDDCVLVLRREGRKASNLRYCFAA